MEQTTLASMSEKFCGLVNCRRISNIEVSSSAPEAHRKMLPSEALLLILCYCPQSAFLNSNTVVWSLPVMCHPFAVCYFHIGESRAEGRVLRAAGVNAKGYFSLSFIQVTDAHLME